VRGGEGKKREGLGQSDTLAMIFYNKLKADFFLPGFLQIAGE